MSKASISPAATLAPSGAGACAAPAGPASSRGNADGPSGFLRSPTSSYAIPGSAESLPREAGGSSRLPAHLGARKLLRWQHRPVLRARLSSLPCPVLCPRSLLRSVPRNAPALPPRSPAHTRVHRAHTQTHSRFLSPTDACQGCSSLLHVLDRSETRPEPEKPRGSRSFCGGQGLTAAGSGLRGSGLSSPPQPRR